MKKIAILCFALIMVNINMHGQDKYLITKLISGQAQAGFPTWTPDGK
jgi:hypothetical protein